MFMTAPARDYHAPPTPQGDVEAASIEEAFDQITVPLGFRAELIDGEIVVTPPADGNHELSISSFSRQIYKHDAHDLEISGGKGLLTPGGRCIPDITVGSREAFLDAEAWSPVDGVELVAEVTSSNADRDRVVKRHRYAAADIPLYLLIDRDERTVTLFSDPDVETEDYREAHKVPYGKALPLPEPFGFDLDTSQLP